MTFEGQDKTYHLADEKFFDSLKKPVVFINTARGGVVNTSALKAAIKAGRIKAAVLDVWEDEPAIDTDLLEMVDIGTPHIAGYSYDGKIAGMIMIYKAACKYFGLEAKHRVEDFLPEPEVAEIRIDCDSGEEQDIIHQTVQQVYVINRDDFNTREIVTVEAEVRGRLFDDLRKNYPVRREFQNTRILLETPCDTLAKKLKVVGFKVENIKK